MIPRYSAVILDMDGLALDTESTYMYAWQQAASRFGATLTKDFCHNLLGRHSDDVMNALRQEIGPRFNESRFHATATSWWYKHISTHGVPAMQGLERLLDLLSAQQTPYALATNSDEPFVNACLAASGMTGRFPVIVTRNQVAHGKPQPDLFLAAASRLAIAPASCLVLEDSETGLTAATAAGTLPILVTTRPITFDTADLALAIFDSLDSVAEAIENPPVHLGDPSFHSS